MCFIPWREHHLRMPNKNYKIWNSLKVHHKTNEIYIFPTVPSLVTTRTTISYLDLSQWFVTTVKNPSTIIKITNILWPESINHDKQRLRVEPSKYLTKLNNYVFYMNIIQHLCPDSYETTVISPATNICITFILISILI